MRQPPHECDLPPTRRIWLGVGVIVTGLVLAGCRTKHEIDVAPTQHTVKIEPIYMTVNINLAVQRELDEFYEDVTEGSKEGTGL